LTPEKTETVMEISDPRVKGFGNFGVCLGFSFLSFQTLRRKLYSYIQLSGEKEIVMRLTALALTLIALLAFAIAPGALIGQETAGPNMQKLLNPNQMNEAAPEKYQVKFDTSKGEFIVEVTTAWSPNGANRFYNLVKNGYYDNCRFFRVIEGFMLQFGINGDPKINAVWNRTGMKDDPVKESNKRGYITYAKSGAPNSRTTQVFINFGNNSRLDADGFTPFGVVIGNGMKVVDSLYSGYGEGAPGGRGPEQGRIQAEGNAYLEKSFPKLDYIKTATIVTPAAK
jgi:peptidyl-prolyl cis-trans isomerase A (cyclophilin A)